MTYNRELIRSRKSNTFLLFFISKKMPLSGERLKANID